MRCSRCDARLYLDVVLALALHRWIGLFSERIYRGLLLFASGVLAAYGFEMVGRAATADR